MPLHIVRELTTFPDSLQFLFRPYPAPSTTKDEDSPPPEIFHSLFLDSAVLRIFGIEKPSNKLN